MLFAINAPFTTRDYVSDPFFESLVSTVRKHGMTPVFSSYQDKIKEYVEDNGAEFEPLVMRGSGFIRKQLWKIRNSFLNPAVVYRHNDVNQFAHQQRFKEITRKWGKSDHPAIRGYDIWPSYLGFPFPRSRLLLRGLSKILWSGIFNHSDELERIFKKSKPALVIVGFVQRPISFSYIHYARKAGVPVVGVVGSWDHLTKEGPFPPSIEECWVWNETMRQEAIDFHDVDPKHIQVLGGSQFDKYRITPTQSEIETMHERFNIGPGQQVITFTANTNPRGVGEPTIVEYLAHKLQTGELGLDKNTVIVVRSHPFDIQFEERFGPLRSHANVRLWEATPVKESSVEEMRLDARLTSTLLNESKMLLCGQGTPAIDAACADLPTINIAFDGTEDVPDELGVRYRYEVDHYRKLLSMDGTVIAESFDELDAAVREYAANPGLKSEGRKRIREEFAGITSDELSSDRIAARLDAILSRL